MSMINATPFRELDRLELICLAYLCLPVALLVVGWFYWPIALALLALLAWSIFSVSRQIGLAAPLRPMLTPQAWIVLGLVACVWVSLSGLSGHFLLNGDWSVRLAVLRDLSVMPWPVHYPQADGSVLLLRAPLGYYLAPSLIGQLAGLDAARIALWCWTVIGVTLFLAMVTVSTRGISPHGGWLPILVAIGFSGMDAIGSWLKMGSWPEFAEHIEWWAKHFQYSSNTTLLFWVPNHALPGWLVTLTIWRHREQGLSTAAAALLLLCLVAWAPLVAVGVVPFLFISCLQKNNWRTLLRETFSSRVLAVIPLGLLIAKLLTFSGSTNTQIASDNPNLWQPWSAEMLIFGLLEWGLLALTLLLAGFRHKLLWAACAILTFLPFLKFGPGNDVVMRGGIPAITIIMLFTIDLLKTQTPSIKQKINKIFALLLITIGCTTPTLEIERGIALENSTSSKINKNFIEQHGTPWHYVEKITDAWVFWVLNIKK